MDWKEFGEISYDFEEDLFEQVRLMGELYRKSFKENGIAEPPLDPLQMLILAEEEKEIEMSIIADGHNGDESDFYSRDDNWPDGEALRPFFNDFNQAEVPEIKSYLFSSREIAPISRGRISECLINKENLLCDSHSRRGRKPCLRKQKRKNPAERFDFIQTSAEKYAEYFFNFFEH